MRISVIGGGYVGLGTIIGFCGSGHQVKCIERDKRVIARLKEGNAPFYEEGLDDLLSTFVNNDGSLTVSADYRDILDTDITFVCVPTPRTDGGNLNLEYVEGAVRQLGKVLTAKERYHVVVVRSSVVPGTTREVIIPLLEASSGKRVAEELGVVVNPEFLREGEVVRFSQKPYRVIIGASDGRSGDMVEEAYAYCPAPVVRTDVTTAEMIKYASNAFLASRISFINEIGNICKGLGVDVFEVADGMGHDPRIGRRFLNAGIGFGGSCLPKDLDALIAQAGETGYHSGLLSAVSEVNRGQPVRMVEIARKRMGSLENKVIAVLGLAFKPNTDDVREAPAILIIGRLLDEGALVKTYDPHAMPRAREVLRGDVEFCPSVSGAIENADCVLIMTEWDEFRDEKLYAGKLVVDGRRALDPDKARAVCDYEGICW